MRGAILIEVILDRRRFIALGCCALGVPTPSTAQVAASKRIYRVGFVSSIGTPHLYPLSDPRSGIIRPFADGMRELGYVDGENLMLMRRSAEGALGKGGEIATALIHDGAEVIVVVSTTLAKEMMTVTMTVPIVMAASVDAVGKGVAETLARPGKNVTGFDIQPGPEFESKRLQLLKETVPGLSRIAFLGTKEDWVSSNAVAARSAATQLGLGMFHAGYTQANFADAFELIARNRPQAVIVSTQPASNFSGIIEFALQQKMPTIYPWRQYVESGGLMSFGADLLDQYRRAAGYVDRILKGEKPADLPIQQPTKFEFVINLKTAKAIGLEMPAPILAQATEVIE
jgi:putative ABC transport system substrate-binding protein